MRIREALNRNCEALIYSSSERMSSHDSKLTVPFSFVAIDTKHSGSVQHVLNHLVTNDC